MARARPAGLPSRPIERLTRPLQHFLQIEAASGVLLLACAIAAVVLANSAWGPAYVGFWAKPLTVGVGSAELSYPLWYWVNDGLMAIFFFLIGLELKRELVSGELREPRRAVLPVVAALGGAAVPAGLFYALAPPEAAGSGWAVPMATDIAFVVGCLALLGARVPRGLKVFMLSLAIVDDLLAILVIALFFTSGLAWSWVAGAALGVVCIALMNRVGVRSLGAYLLVGGAVWLCTLKSGLHPTLAGVILGLMTPSRPWLKRELLASTLGSTRAALDAADEDDAPLGDAVDALVTVARESLSPLARLEHGLHPWVAFVIMPLFALANAGVVISGEAMASQLSVAVALGLLVGKPLGIVLAAAAAVKLRAASLPSGVGWGALLGAGCLGGIGFTMALFLATLGLEAEFLDAGKQGVLLGSLVSGLLGMGLLALTLRRPPPDAPSAPP